MVLKIVALAALVGCGLFFVKAPHGMASPVLDRPVSFGLLAAMGAAMTPVMFAYGGWQTASFVSGEMREPRRHLAQGLLIGVIGVIVLYTAVNFVYVYVLGQGGLAATKTPASDVMRFAFGERGATLIAIGISISTLGFLSQGMLTAPRVYFAMAEDGLFFKSVAWLNPRTRVPVVAIALQGVFAVVIALSGKYEQILNYVISVDFIWFGLTAASLFVFRHRALKRRELESETKNPVSGLTQATAINQEVDSTVNYFRVPGHPLTTALFVIACALIVFSTIYTHLEDSWIGLLILVSGIPVYFFWRWWRRK